jgi:hypothetical protein
MINNNKKLFDFLQCNSNEEFEKLINSIEKEQSLFYLIQSVKSAYKRGCFSLEESEIISKSLRVLSTPEKNNEA